MLVQAMHISVTKVLDGLRQSLPALEIYHQRVQCSGGGPTRVEVWKLEGREQYSLKCTCCQEEFHIGPRDLGVIIMTAFDGEQRIYSMKDNYISVVSRKK